MSLQDQWNAAFGPNATAGLSLPGLNTLGPAAAFRQRCIMAAISAALSVAQEPTGTGNHANRAALGKAITDSPLAWLDACAAAVAAQGIDNSALDQPIKDAIWTAWNMLAGAL